MKLKRNNQQASTLPLNTMLFLKSFYVTILHYYGRSSFQQAGRTGIIHYPPRKCTETQPQRQTRRDFQKARQQVNVKVGPIDVGPLIFVMYHSRTECHASVQNATLWKFLRNILFSSLLPLASTHELLRSEGSDLFPAPTACYVTYCYQVSC